MNGIGELHCIGTCPAEQKKLALGNLQIPNKYPFFQIFIWYLHKERGEIVKRGWEPGFPPPLNAARRAE